MVLSTWCNNACAVIIYSICKILHGGSLYFHTYATSICKSDNGNSWQCIFTLEDTFLFICFSICPRDNLNSWWSACGLHKHPKLQDNAFLTDLFFDTFVLENCDFYFNLHQNHLASLSFRNFYSFVLWFGGTYQNKNLYAVVCKRPCTWNNLSSCSLV